MNSFTAGLRSQLGLYAAGPQCTPPAQRLKCDEDARRQQSEAQPDRHREAEARAHQQRQAGAAFGIKPIGLAARDTLRLEMGFCLYGNDINDTTSPLEAGLGWITKFTKDFTNSENLKKQKEAGITRKLVAFEMQERAVPRHDYEIVDATGTVIGIVTSGTMSPSMNKGIGLGYVTIANSALESDIFIRIRKK